MIAKQTIRLAISAALKKHDIDCLMIEGEVADAVFKVLQAQEDGKDESEIAGDALDSFVQGHEKIKAREEIIIRMQDTLKLNIDPDRWERVINFVMQMEAQGQTIEEYQAWRIDDIFNSPKGHQIAQRPMIIRETWPQAFEKAEQLVLLDKSEGGGIDV